MKQPLHSTSVGVDAGEIWPLERVTELAGECQIFKIVRAAVADREDMLDMECAVGLVFLPQPAVFAPVSGSEYHLAAYGARHAPAASRLR
jgi:hypothetical protein